MRSAVIASAALALAGSVAAAPAPAPLQERDASEFDQPLCYWKSQSSFYVSWVITIPQYDGKSTKDAKGDFIGSMNKNSACRGPSAAPGTKEWYSVGAHNTTTLLSFDTSDFCTAYQMTKVIKKTTGNVQSTACKKWKDGSSGTDPDPSNLLVDLPEDGDDGEDGMFKRDGNSPPTDAEMAKLLNMPPNSSHEDIVAKLNGPSPLDDSE